MLLVHAAYGCLHPEIECAHHAPETQFNEGRYLVRASRAENKKINGSATALDRRAVLTAP